MLSLLQNSSQKFTLIQIYNTYSTIVSKKCQILYNHDMDICAKIKSILVLQKMQIKEFADLLNEKTGSENYNGNNLSAKLNRDTISFKEAEMMLNILGYKIDVNEI